MKNKIKNKKQLTNQILVGGIKDASSPVSLSLYKNKIVG